MKIGATVSAILIAAAAMAGVWWMTRSSSPAAVATVGETALSKSDEVHPSQTGPHPKVVLPEAHYDFGVMKMGDSGTHTFVVRNEGKAPLKLGKPRTTCQCTISEAAKNEIPPGGEGTITLDWKPTSPAERFDKGAFIPTNDPEMPEITLAVIGRVDPLVVVEPTGNWFAGKVVGDTPIVVTGYVYSRLLDDLKIESARSENPLLTAVANPMSDEKLKEYDAKTGYEIVATLSPGIPVGRFNEPLTIETNVDDKSFQKIETTVTGTRQGPIEVLPTPGADWNAEHLMIDLGRFPAAAGASARVSMFVSHMPEGETLVFEKVDSSVPDIHLNLKRDEAFDAPHRQKYELTFSVKPGATPAARRGAGMAKVEVTTNHPGAKSMKFRVQYIAAP